VFVYGAARVKSLPDKYTMRRVLIFLLQKEQKELVSLFPGGIFLLPGKWVPSHLPSKNFQKNI